MCITAVDDNTMKDFSFIFLRITIQFLQNLKKFSYKIVEYKRKFGNSILKITMRLHENIYPNLNAEITLRK